MTKVLIINTGGTFNKVYHPIKGELEVGQTGSALNELTSKWLCKFEIIDIIGKDSLEITEEDRSGLLATISDAQAAKIIIVHGTDTMDITAEYLADAQLNKSIILTGAMVPYSIDPVEATANLCSAYGFIQSDCEHGIYIAMNGVIGNHDKVKKDRALGKFILTN